VKREISFMDDNDISIVSERRGTKRIKREPGVQSEVVDLT
jgi:hypothetical protein